MDPEFVARLVRCGGDLRGVLAEVDRRGALALADAAEGLGSVDEAAMYHAMHVALVAAMGGYVGCSDGLMGVDAELGSEFVSAVNRCDPSAIADRGDEFFGAVVRWLRRLVELACSQRCD